MGDGETSPTIEAMPHHLGRYDLVLPLSSVETEGRALFLGHVPGSEEPYALVELFAKDGPAFGAVSLDDVRRVSRLRHTNVVQLLDAETCDLGTFIATEYVPGNTLAALQHEAREAGSELPRAIALRILTDALRGLHVLHDHIDTNARSLDLVHRDFSPRNILVGTDGIARITGFGLRSAEAATMAPEQAAGRPIDRRADLWSAGVLAWETITGRELPRDAPNDDPPRLRAVAAVDPALDEAIARALRVDPLHRIGTARQLAEELSHAASAAGLLADLEEVAAHVERSARATLKARKLQFAEARRALLQRPRSAPDVRTMIGMAAPVLKRGPLPDLPMLPVAHDDGASELRIAVAVERRIPADRASDDILGEPSVVPPAVEEAGEIIRPPFGFAGETAPKPGVGGVRWTTKTISIAAGAGGLLIGFIIILAAVSGRHRSPTAAPSTPAAEPSSTATVVELTPPAATPVWTALPPPTARGAPPPASAADPPLLHIMANGAIASVQVGGRLVDAVVPAPTVSVELSAEESATALDIIVTSTDGRTATLKTTAGRLDADVVFGDKPAPRPVRTAPTTTSTVKPWSKRPH